VRLWRMAAGSRGAGRLARGESARRRWSGARVTLLAGVSPGKLACPLRLGVSEA